MRSDVRPLIDPDDKLVSHLNCLPFPAITNYLPMSLATKEMVKRYNDRQKAANVVAPRLAIPGIGVDLQQVQNVGVDALHQVEEHLDLFSAQRMFLHSRILCPYLMTTHRCLSLYNL